MTIEAAILNADINLTEHASARRAIEKVLKRSKGEVPLLDLLNIVEIVTAAIERHADRNDRQMGLL
jgi:hypothetical protein